MWFELAHLAGVQARTEAVIKIALSSFTLPMREPQYPPLIFVATAVQPLSPRVKILYNSKFIKSYPYVVLHYYLSVKKEVYS